MKWVESKDLENWSCSIDARSNLPLLVRRLIRGSVRSINKILFPSCENVQHGGWDGILKTETGNEYVPSGISLWELGCGNEYKTKANNDYKKRSEDSLGYNKSECTFVFVTPRFFNKKDKWVQEKKKENIWKDIKVIDSEVLEEWLEVTPTVSSWLAIKLLGTYPEGVQSVDEFWDRWSQSDSLKLNPDILLGGRENEVNSLFEKVFSPSIIFIESSSRDESLAFVIACFKNDKSKEEDFFSRSIIIENKDAFKKIVSIDKPLIIISRVEDNQGLFHSAERKGHTVIVPVDRSSSNSNKENKTIPLPIIDRESFIKSLVNIGISKEIAEKYSRETARNITILRRQLEFDYNTPEWARPDNIRDLVPIILAGRWSENNEADKQVIAYFADDSYENYLIKLKKWEFSSDSPIIKVSSIWRLTSPLDAWSNGVKYLTTNDFDKLKSKFLEVYSEIDPAFELEENQRFFASVHNKVPKFSEKLREGLVQSLILISNYGERLGLEKGKDWVDNVIFELLNNDTPNFWMSISSELPLIAEASPDSFLNSIERNLDDNNPNFIDILKEEPGLLTNKAYYIGLLWGIENLAWIPDYLARSSIIFARLSEIAPEGTWTNKPIDSLKTIFKLWNPQTQASYDERVEVLKLLTKKHPKTAWELLLDLLPKISDHSFGTSKMRWRLFEYDFKVNLTYKEIYDSQEKTIELLLSICQYDEEKLAIIVEKSDSINLINSARNKLLNFLKDNRDKINQDKYSIWFKLRKILNNHRSYSDAKWSLSKEILKEYEELYNIFKPQDIVADYIWLFDDYAPSFIEGNKYQEDYKQYDEFVLEKRKEGLKVIYDSYGIEKVLELLQESKESRIFSDVLGYILENRDDIIKTCELLKTERGVEFLYGFIWRKLLNEGYDWIIDLFNELKEKGFDNFELANLFIPLKYNQKLWDFIENTNSEIIYNYWSKIDIHPHGLNTDEINFALSKLIKQKRYLSAISTIEIAIIFDRKSDILSEIIIEILIKLATTKDNKKINIDSHIICKMFEILYEHNDIDENDLMQLEFIYSSFLVDNYNGSKPQTIFRKLSKEPIFFIELVQYIRKSEIEEHNVQINKGLSKEEIANRASKALEILESWDVIPGLQSDKSVDFNFLNNWIDETRKIAEKTGYLKVVDYYIGEILVKYPTDKYDEYCPPDEICEIIEKIGTEDVKSGFDIATYNKRSFSVRHPSAGGTIERGYAEKFREASKKLRNRYPFVSKILNDILRHYEYSAKREDDNAEYRNLEY